MRFDVTNSKLLLAGLLAATSLLTGCATAGSDPACPPVVPYAQVDLDRAASDLFTLPPDSPIIDMLSDYAVMRDQARACR